MCILVLMTLYFQNTSDLHAIYYMYVLIHVCFMDSLKKIVKLSLISSEILHFEVRRHLPGKCKMDKSRFKVYFLFCHSKYHYLR